jgi:hypothetical protein
MPADLRIVHSTDREDEWSVALDGRYVVGFYGRGAREMAERHMNELAEMLALREHAMTSGDGLADAADVLDAAPADAAAEIVSPTGEKLGETGRT